MSEHIFNVLESSDENQKFLICQIDVSEILSSSHIFATDLWVIFK